MNPVNNKILKEMMNKGLCVKPGSITRRKRVFRKLKQVLNWPKNEYKNNRDKAAGLTGDMS